MCISIKFQKGIDMIEYGFIKKYESEDGIVQNKYVEIDYNNDAIRVERRLFNIETYSALLKSKFANITSVNDFIRMNFDHDEYDYLVRLFVRSRRELVNTKTGEEIVNAVSVIDGFVYKCFKKLNLANRLYEFVKADTKISLPDFANKEMRPQDTEEKTFYEEDYRQINVIIMIAKILIPIFGEIIYRIKLANDSYKNMREIVAFGIINSTLRDDFERISFKLQNYIYKMIDRLLNDESMIPFNGVTSASLTDHQFATIVVRNFANHDFYRENGNIIRSIIVTLKRKIENETNSSNQSIAYFERSPPKSSDDDRNDSIFENSINAVSEAVEISVIVRAAVEKFISKYIKDNNIDQTLFDKAVKFYEVTIVQPTIINELLISLFISKPLISAYCTKYFDMKIFIKLIVLIQIYMYNQGFKTIVPLMTLTLTDIIKTETSDTDNRIILNNGRSSNPNATNYHFVLSESLSHLRDWSGFNFGEYIKSLTLFLVEHIYMYNVAPGLLNQFGDTGSSKSIENKVFAYDDDIISELHRFMYHLLKVADTNRNLT